MSLGQFDPNYWTPARYVHAAQRCHFCRGDIPRSKPGTRTGDRGTKAFYNPALRLFECTDCRLEGSRAEQARWEPRAPVTEACRSCGYKRLDVDSPLELPLFALRPCPGCEGSPERGMHRICPRCGHVEHRSYLASPRAAA